LNSTTTVSVLYIFTLHSVMYIQQPLCGSGTYEVRCLSFSRFHVSLSTPTLESEKRPVFDTLMTMMT